MLTRSAIALIAAFVVVGCANETPTIAGFATTSSVAVATPPVALSPEQQPPRKTMSDRVLTAIALERVTGLKPDPARFSE